MADFERVGLIVCVGVVMGAHVTGASLAPLHWVGAHAGAPLRLVGAWRRAAHRLWLPVMAGGAAQPVKLVQDAFTDTNGVYLDEHTPDAAPVGAAWQFISTPQAFEVQSNRARLNTFDGYCEALIDAGEANVAMQLTVITGDGSDDYAELLLRYDAASGDYIAVGISKAGLFYLVESVGGVRSTLDSEAIAYQDNHAYTITVSVKGAAVSAGMDSYTLAATLTSPTSHTQVGFAADHPLEPAAYFQFDDLSVSTNP